MRFLRWCGRVAVAVAQWLGVFFVLANLAQVLPSAAGLVFVRIYASFVGSFFATVWLRRRLRARRASKTALPGQEGVQQ